jgi:hypothetical protein
MTKSSLLYIGVYVLCIVLAKPPKESYTSLVIPAEAGIQLLRTGTNFLDTRFRGYDGFFEIILIAT